MNIRDLDLNLLFVFDSIYATGNISAAARDMQLSQPAVSNALARLRKQLDDQLFIRNGNGVSPTARADALIGPIRAALEGIKSGIEGSQTFDSKNSKRHFRLVVAEPLEKKILCQLIGYDTQNSDISYELLPPQNVSVEQALLQEKIDLAVFLMPAHFEELRSTPICDVDLVVLARDGHPRISGEIVAAEQISKENFVGLNLEPGKLANSEKVTVWHRIYQKTICRVYKVSTIAQIVSGTDLVGIVPNIYAQQIRQQLAVQVLKLPVPLSNQQFQLIWHKRHDEDDGHIWLREKILSMFLAG